jgi:hypothetical protein
MTYCALDLVENYLRRFIAYPNEHALTAHILWIAHAHLIEDFETTPRLAFMSAEKESGKTRALEVTALLVPYPILSISASPALIVGLVSGGKPTILYDEIDGVFGNAKIQEANVDLRSVLNGGYRRGAKVHRCVVHGKKVDTETLDAFAPVAVTGLRTLPLASRCIFIRMRRRASDEAIEAFRYRYHVDQAKPIKQALVDWCEQHAAAIGNAEPDLPNGIEDRAADFWEPLRAIADDAADGWPERARAAAVYLTDAAAEESLTAGVELLSHIRDAFGAEEKMPTAILLEKLHARDESPWNDIRGKPLNDRGLASRLKPYRIRSKNVWEEGNAVRKGYYAADFYDAWKRYLLPPDLSAMSAMSAMSARKLNHKNKNLADIADIAAERQETGGNGLSHLYPDDLPGLDENEALEDYYPELAIPPELDRRRK